MSHHRYPICPISGKIRYGELKDIKLELRQADRDRSRARLNEVTCSRRETRGYRCTDCGGWHLTSQPVRPLRLVPAAQLTAFTPRPAAEAIRRIAAVTGLGTGTAA
jgi:hypothetical protein